MKFVNDATAKDTAFIKCFPDDSGVYARVLTETELDTLRVKSRTFNGNEKRTPELMDRRFKILHLQRALSGWEGLEFEDGSPHPLFQGDDQGTVGSKPQPHGDHLFLRVQRTLFREGGGRKKLRDWCGRLVDNAPSCDECRETWALDGWNRPAAPVPFRKWNSCPTTSKPCISGRSATSTPATSWAWPGQARPIRLEAVRAECDRTDDPEGNFQKAMLIEAVLFPVRYLKKRH